MNWEIITKDFVIFKFLKDGIKLRMKNLNIIGFAEKSGFRELHKKPKYRGENCLKWGTAVFRVAWYANAHYDYCRSYLRNANANRHLANQENGNSKWEAGFIFKATEKDLFVLC